VFLIRITSPPTYILSESEPTELAAQSDVSHKRISTLYTRGSKIKMGHFGTVSNGAQPLNKQSGKTQKKKSCLS
jgi:hypothetical protein